MGLEASTIEIGIKHNDLVDDGKKKKHFLSVSFSKRWVGKRWRLILDSNVVATLCYVYARCCKLLDVWVCVYVFEHAELQHLSYLQVLSYLPCFIVYTLVRSCNACQVHLTYHLSMRERHAYLYDIYTHCVCYILVYSIRILFVYVHTPTAKLPRMAPFTDVPAFGGILLLLPKGQWPWETSDEQAMRKMPERLEIVEDVFTLTKNNENPHWK